MYNIFKIKYTIKYIKLEKIKKKVKNKICHIYKKQIHELKHIELNIFHYHNQL